MTHYDPSDISAIARTVSNLNFSAPPKVDVLKKSIYNTPTENYQTINSFVRSRSPSPKRDNGDNKWNTIISKNAGLNIGDLINQTLSNKKYNYSDDSDNSDNEISVSSNSRRPSLSNNTNKFGNNGARGYNASSGRAAKSNIHSIKPINIANSNISNAINPNHGRNISNASNLLGAPATNDINYVYNYESNTPASANSYSSRNQAVASSLGNIASHNRNPSTASNRIGKHDRTKSFVDRMLDSIDRGEPIQSSSDIIRTHSGNEAGIQASAAIAALQQQAADEAKQRSIAKQIELKQEEAAFAEAKYNRDSDPALVEAIFAADESPNNNIDNKNFNNQHRRSVSFAINGGNNNNGNPLAATILQAQGTSTLNVASGGNKSRSNSPAIPSNAQTLPFSNNLNSNSSNQSHRRSSTSVSNPNSNFNNFSASYSNDNITPTDANNPKSHGRQSSKIIQSYNIETVDHNSIDTNIENNPHHRTISRELRHENHDIDNLEATIQISNEPVALDTPVTIHNITTTSNATMQSNAQFTNTLSSQNQQVAQHVPGDNKRSKTKSKHNKSSRSKQNQQQVPDSNSDLDSPFSNSDNASNSSQNQADDTRHINNHSKHKDGKFNSESNSETEASSAAPQPKSKSQFRKLHQYLLNKHKSKFVKSISVQDKSLIAKENYLKSQLQNMWNRWKLAKRLNSKQGKRELALSKLATIAVTSYKHTALRLWYNEVNGVHVERQLSKLIPKFRAYLNQRKLFHYLQNWIEAKIDADHFEEDQTITRKITSKRNSNATKNAFKKWKYLIFEHPNETKQRIKTQAIQAFIANNSVNKPIPKLVRRSQITNIEPINDINNEVKVEVFRNSNSSTKPKPINQPQQIQQQFVDHRTVEVEQNDNKLNRSKSVTKVTPESIGLNAVNYALLQSDYLLHQAKLIEKNNALQQARQQQLIKSQQTLIQNQNKLKQLQQQLRLDYAQKHSFNQEIKEEPILLRSQPNPNIHYNDRNNNHINYGNSIKNLLADNHSDGNYDTSLIANHTVTKSTVRIRIKPKQPSAENVSNNNGDGNINTP